MGEEVIIPTEETFNYHSLRYILDKDGYICHASLGGLVVCDLGECTEYNGEIPTDYETIENWYDGEIDKLNAWKIVDGNLVFDENKYNELQKRCEQEAEENQCATHKWVNNKLSSVNEVFEDDLSIIANGKDLFKITDAKNTEIVTLQLVANDFIYDNLKLLITNENMLPNNAFSQTIAGVTFTVNEDRTITLNGTSTEVIEFILNGSKTSEEILFFFKKDTNYMKCGFDNDVLLNLYFYDGENTELVTSGGNETLNFSDTKYITCSSLYIESGTKFKDVTISPMITTGKYEDKTYIQHKGNKVLNVDFADYKLNIKDTVLIERDELTINAHDCSGLYPSKNLFPSKTLFPKSENSKKITYSIIPLNSFEDLTIIQCDYNVDIQIRYFSKDYLNQKFTSIEVGQENIKSEVAKKLNEQDLGTKIIQNWESVQIAWNQISEYIKFEGENKQAVLNIYDGEDNKIAQFSRHGIRYYDKEKYIGQIGRSYRNSGGNGLAFLGKDVDYMDWSMYNPDTGYYYAVMNYDKPSDNISFECETLFRKDATFKGYARDRFGNYFVSSDVLDWITVTPSNYFYVEYREGGSCWIPMEVATSDGRLKKNICDTEVNALEQILKIKHRQFDWKETDKHQPNGYIAQEMKEINEDWVDKVPQFDENRNATDYIYRIDDFNVLSYATKAIQELSEKIDNQQKEIDYLYKELEKVKPVVKPKDKTNKHNVDYGSIKKNKVNKNNVPKSKEKTYFKMENGVLKEMEGK